MRRFTIMGFTEAELGFVLAALFVAVAVSAVHERDASAVTVEAHQSLADSLRAEAAEARDSLALVRNDLTVLRNDLALLGDSLTTLQDKISTKVPQCWERGEASAPIADLAVLGANRFELNGSTMTIEGITEHLSAFIERGSELGCRFVVRARPTSGIDAVQQSAAVWRLRRYFDVNDRPQ